MSVLTYISFFRIVQDCLNFSIVVAFIFGTRKTATRKRHVQIAKPTQTITNHFVHTLIIHVLKEFTNRVFLAGYKLLYILRTFSFTTTRATIITTHSYSPRSEEHTS